MAELTNYRVLAEVQQNWRNSNSPILQFANSLMFLQFSPHFPRRVMGRAAWIAEGDDAKTRMVARGAHIWRVWAEWSCTIFWHRVVDELHSIENTIDIWQHKTVDIKPRGSTTPSFFDSF